MRRAPYNPGYLWMEVRPGKRPVRVMRHTPAYFRLTAAGFAFGEPQFDPMSRTITGTFRCVCGREETYALTYMTGAVRALDVATLIELGGAVSARHLKDDGYSREQIQHIRRAYV